MRFFFLNIISVLFFLPMILTVPKCHWSCLFSILCFPSSNSDPLQTRALHLDPLGDSSLFFESMTFPISFFFHRPLPIPPTDRTTSIFKPFPGSYYCRTSPNEINIQKYLNSGVFMKPRWRSSTKGIVWHGNVYICIQPGLRLH